MAQVLYISPDPDMQDRATVLGCGWMPTVPAQFANIADAPCVILSGAGRTIVLPDTGDLTNDAVLTELQPLLDAEQAVVDAPTTVTLTADRQVLTDLLTEAQKATTVAATRNVLTALLQQLQPNG